MNAARLLAHYERIADAPDAVTRLRRFILDLAVRGRLVEQHSNDEHASGLAKRIASERAKSMTTSENRRMLGGKGALGTPPFELPQTWIWVAFGDIHQLVRGVTYSKSDISEVPSENFVPVLRANNIGPVLTHDEPVYVKRSCVAAGQFLRAGDFMIALSSGSKNLVGKAAFVPKDYQEAFGGFCGVIRLVSPLLQGFVRVFLQGDLYRESISAGSRGIGINNLKKETVSNLLFPLPPLTEQHRIVAKVDELMALCDRLEAARTEREAKRDRLAAASLARLDAPAPDTFRDDARFALDALPALTARLDQIKHLRQTILNLAVRGTLVPQDPRDEAASNALAAAAEKRLTSKTGRDWTQHMLGASDPRFVLPSGWALARIAETVERVTVGYVGPMKDQYVDEGIPFLRSQNVRANRFREVGLIYISPHFHQSIMKSALVPGDVVVVRSGNVGTACVIPPSVPEANCSDLVVIKSPECVLPRYLAYYLNSLASAHIEAGSVGVALTHFNTKSVATMPIPVPPLAEQYRIVAKVDELMALCDRLEASLTTGDTTRRKLLDALLAEALAPASRESEVTA